jgi:DNA-directed RNA polymerase specialized sigma24 family protein
MRAILDAILALEEPGRSALILRYVERRGLRDIGRMTEVADATANRRVHRALALLKEALHSSRS